MYAVATSSSYNFFMNVSMIANQFIIRLYEGLAEAAYVVYALMLSAMMIYFLYRYLTNTASNILAMFGQVLLVLVTYQFAFKSEIFLNWIYYPVIQSIYNMSGYILLVAANLPTNAPDHLYAGFLKVDIVLEDLLLAYMKVITADNPSAWDVFTGNFHDFLVAMAGGVLYILLALLKIFFVIIFSIAIASAHILLAAFPFTIVFAAYQQSRWIFGASVRGFFRFALTPVFAAIAMGISLYVFADLHRQAQIILDPDFAGDASDGFFMTSLIATVFSLYLMSKSSEFAGILTQGGAGMGLDWFQRGASVAPGYGSAPVNLIKNIGKTVGGTGAKLAVGTSVAGYSSAVRFFTKSAPSKAGYLGIK